MYFIVPMDIIVPMFFAVPVPNIVFVRHLDHHGNQLVFHSLPKPEDGAAGRAANRLAADLYPASIVK
jgi:hypothetical protein